MSKRKTKPVSVAQFRVVHPPGLNTERPPVSDRRKDWRAVEARLVDFCRAAGFPPHDVNGAPHLAVPFFDDDDGSLLAMKMLLNLEKLARYLTDANQ